MVTLFGKAVVLLGSDGLHLVAEIAWGEPGLIAKYPAEIGFLTVSHLITHLRNRFRGVKQELFCLDQSPGFDDFGNAFSKNLLAYQVQITGGGVKLIGIKPNTFGLSEVFAKKFQKPIEKDQLGISCVGRIRITWASIRFKL